MSDLLSTQAALYRKAFRDYWSTSATAAPPHLEEEEWLAAKLVCPLAKSLVAAVTSATPTPGFDPAGVARALDRGRDEYGELRWLFQQAIEMEFSRELSAELGKLRQRARELQSVLMSVPGHRARAWLWIVAPCYLRGMRAEGLVMCGAILDAVLREHMEGGGAPADKPGKDARADRRLALLEGSGAIDADTLDRARRVDAARRCAVWPPPPDEATLRGAVEDLAIVLARLSLPRPPPAPPPPRAAQP